MKEDTPTTVGAVVSDNLENSAEKSIASDKSGENWWSDTSHVTSEMLVCVHCSPPRWTLTESDDRTCRKCGGDVLDADAPEGPR